MIRTEWYPVRAVGRKPVFRYTPLLYMKKSGETAITAERKISVSPR